MSDPYAAQRADDAFLNILFEGRAEASLAMTDVMMVAHQHRHGGIAHPERSERLTRAAQRLRTAADRVDQARERGEGL